jgi:hypothetical protein
MPSAVRHITVDCADAYQLGTAWTFGVELSREERVRLAT